MSEDLIPEIVLEAIGAAAKNGVRTLNAELKLLCEIMGVSEKRAAKMLSTVAQWF